MTKHTEALFELIEKSDLPTSEVNVLIALMAFDTSAIDKPTSAPSRSVGRRP